MLTSWSTAVSSVFLLQMMNLTFGWFGKVTLAGIEPATFWLSACDALPTEVKCLSNSETISKCQGYNPGGSNLPISGVTVGNTEMVDSEGQAKWDEDDVMLFLWANSKAVKDRYHKKNKESTQDVDQWRHGVSQVSWPSLYRCFGILPFHYINIIPTFDSKVILLAPLAQYRYNTMTLTNCRKL